MLAHMHIRFQISHYMPAICLPLALATLYMQHFDLVEEKELAPLSELIEQFLAGKMNSIR
jgi:hypothetical protein